MAIAGLMRQAEPKEEAMKRPRVDEALWRPASTVKNWNPERFDFHWNDDYSLYQLRPLKWWDDASYIAYQNEDVMCDDFSEARWHRAPEPVEEPDWCSRCGQWGHCMLDCNED